MILNREVWIILVDWRTLAWRLKMTCCSSWCRTNFHFIALTFLCLWTHFFDQTLTSWLIQDLFDVLLGWGWLKPPPLQPFSECVSFDPAPWISEVKTLQRDVVFGRGRLTSPSLQHVLQWSCKQMFLMLGCKYITLIQLFFGSVRRFFFYSAKDAFWRSCVSYRLLFFFSLKNKSIYRISRENPKTSLIIWKHLWTSEHILNTSENLYRISGIN